MRRALTILLGIMTAVGGFVDIGDFVFATQAGSLFGYRLIWALLLGVIGIIVFTEMSGRVAAVAGRPVHVLMRERLGYKMGLAVLVASLILNVLTCAAEVGGVALAIQLLTGQPYFSLLAATTLFLGLVYWILPFKWIERVFGLLGLGMLVWIATTLASDPDWGAMAAGAVPGSGSGGGLLYAYFAIGIFSAAFMPYEVYFYSSGGIEEGWDPGKVTMNRLTVFIGYAVGALVVIGLIATSAQVFGPAGVSPDSVGTAMLGAAAPLGRIGLVLALLGLTFAVGGAAMETSLSAAYGLAQYLGWKWGRHHPPLAVPRFTVAWMAALGLGAIVIFSGVDPVLLTEYAVLLSVAAMPFTYLPLLLAARDPEIMGDEKSGRLTDVLGWIYFFAVCGVALAVVPLMILTHLGSSG